MNLYSLRGARPEPLPFRVTLPTGLTRTDPQTFTADEIAAAGLTGPYQEPPYDPATQLLTWAHGAYSVEALPPPPPSQDWATFKRTVLADPGVNGVLAAAMTAVPAAALAVPSALLRAEDGNPSDFGGCWRAILAAVPSAHALVPALSAAAQAANLPEEFIGAVQGQRVRARDALGRFIADDPATPEVDEAWV